MTEKFRNKYRIPSARLQHWDYGWNGAYFITICTKNRVEYFGEIINGEMKLSEIGVLSHKYWLEIPNHFPFVQLDAFVVMPNHIHGIIIIDKQENVRNDGNVNTVETPKLGVSTKTNTTKLGVSTKTNTTKLGVSTKTNTTKLGVSTKTNTTKLGVSTDPIKTPPSPANVNKTGDKNNKWKPGVLGVIINQYKRICTINVRKIIPYFAWQPRFYDHIIRNEKSYYQIAQYIHGNPLKWQDDRYYA